MFSLLVLTFFLKEVSGFLYSFLTLYTTLNCFRRFFYIFIFRNTTLKEYQFYFCIYNLHGIELCIYRMGMKQNVDRSLMLCCLLRIVFQFILHSKKFISIPKKLCTYIWEGVRFDGLTIRWMVTISTPLDFSIPGYDPR